MKKSPAHKLPPPPATAAILLLLCQASTIVDSIDFGLKSSSYPAQAEEESFSSRRKLDNESLENVALLVLNTAIATRAQKPDCTEPKSGRDDSIEEQNSRKRALHW